MTIPVSKSFVWKWTLSTGDFSSDDSVGSEYVGNQLRQAADDPTVEAIVIGVHSPGGTLAAAEEIISDLEYAKAKKPLSSRWVTWPHRRHITSVPMVTGLYADPDTFTGAVGVIWTFSDISGYNREQGYNVSIVKSVDEGYGIDLPCAYTGRAGLCPADRKRRALSGSLTM